MNLKIQLNSLRPSNRVKDDLTSTYASNNIIEYVKHKCLEYAMADQSSCQISLAEIEDAMLFEFNDPGLNWTAIRSNVVSALQAEGLTVSFNAQTRTATISW